jgi:short subunit dehydrogenase-like uncharacterized protein
MSTSDPFLIYGATGYTGRLLAQAAREHGMRPVLCARDERRLAAVAASLALEYRVADLGTGLDRALRGIHVVLHAAGPFVHTFQPMVDACLRTGTHYLDLSGEMTTIEGVSQRDAQARRQKVMLMPGVGFEVVASDCLCAHVSRRLRGAQTLAIGVSGLDLISRGSARTTLGELGRAPRIRRAGAIVDVPAGSLRRAFDFGGGARSSTVVGWADVSSAYYTTGIPNICVFYEETPQVRMMATTNRYFGWVAGSPLARSWLDAQAGALAAGPTEAERARGRAVVVAEVEDGSLRRACARLRTPEAYTFSSTTALAIVNRVLEGDLEIGFQTPARVYGPDFVLQFAGVLREDLR